MILFIIRLALSMFLFLIITLSCSEERTAEHTDCQVLTVDNADDCLRLNQIQVFGTHNSYKLYPDPVLIYRLNQKRPGWADNILYEHRSITTQLADLGVRQLELDIFADPEGGRYAEPAGALMVNDKKFINPPEMLEPGFKVLHTQDFDYRSNCLTLKSCLTEVSDWSLKNPNHLPIMILIEVKDLEPREEYRVPWNFPKSHYEELDIALTIPLEINENLMLEIDKEIWKVFSEDQVITPDNVRGEYETLEEAVLSNGWPTLRESRGKVFFALDNTDASRDIYLGPSPTLKGRAMFVSSDPGTPSAAFIKMNNPVGSYERIQKRVEAGYVIRTRSDSPTYEARTGDMTRQEAALSSGGQYISTDYPEPSPFGSGYIATIPDADPGAEGPGRCNPVGAPPSCQNRFLTE